MKEDIEMIILLSALNFLGCLSAGWMLFHWAGML